MKKLLALLLALGLALPAPAFANDLSNATWSETDASNSAAPPNGWPAGMAANAVEGAARQMMGAAKRSWDRANGAGVVTGTANAIVLTYGVAPPSYVSGEVYSFLATAANTGAATININALGVKNIFRIANGTPTALNGNEIANGGLALIQYDGTQFQLLNPAPDEGSWTPTFFGTGTAGTFTYAANSQIGRYIRVGNLVTVWCIVGISAISVAPTGNLEIAGLPFTSTNVTNFNQSIAIGAVNFITLAGGMTQFSGLIANNSTVLQLFETGSNASTTSIPSSALNAGGVVEFSGSYRIN